MKVQKIVLHHSLTKDSKTVSWAAIRRYHVQTLGWSAIGYHYGIELVGFDYEILVGRLMNQVGAHCIGLNRESLGICFIGNFDTEDPEESMLIVGRGLVKSLLEVFNLGIEDIVGHNQYSNKTCPGKMFSMDVFRESL